MYSKLKIAALTTLSFLFTACSSSISSVDPSIFSEMHFFKNPSVKIRKAADTGDFYQIKATAMTNEGLQRFDAFVTKDKQKIVLGTGFQDTTGQKLFIPENMSHYEKDAAFTYGSGSKKFYIFTDPECPYCKEMEKTLPQFEKTAKFYVYFMPLAFHKNAKSMSMWIMSQQTNQDKWLALHDIATEKTNEWQQYRCANSDQNLTECQSEAVQRIQSLLTRQSEIARLLEVGGTPSLFDERGNDIHWAELGSILGVQNSNQANNK